MLCIHHNFSQTLLFSAAFLAESTIPTRLSSAAFLFLPHLTHIFFLTLCPLDLSSLVPACCFHSFCLTATFSIVFPDLFLFLLVLCIISLLLFKSSLSGGSETLPHFILPLQIYHSPSCLLLHT